VLESLHCLSWTVQGAPADDPLAFAAPKALILFPPQTTNLLCSRRLPRSTLPSTKWPKYRRVGSTSRRSPASFGDRRAEGQQHHRRCGTRCRCLHDAPKMRSHTLLSLSRLCDARFRLYAMQPFPPTPLSLWRPGKRMERGPGRRAQISYAKEKRRSLWRRLEHTQAIEAVSR
jgi:hypothetical protein